MCSVRSEADRPTNTQPYRSPPLGWGRRNIADSQLAVAPQHDEAPRPRINYTGVPGALPFQPASHRQRLRLGLGLAEDKTRAAKERIKRGVRKQPSVHRLAETEPSVLLSKAIRSGAKGHRWRKEVAMARSVQLPILLLQLLLRKGSLALPESSDLRELLPKDEELDSKVELVRRSDPTCIDLDDCLYVLEGQTDDERCERFLERNNPGPKFILAFLLRPYSNITKATTLYSMIESCQSYYEDEVEPGTGLGHQTRTRRLEKCRDRLVHIMTFLTAHCLVVEPRFVVKLGVIAARFVEKMATYADSSEKLYLIQCEVFNSALSVLQPRQGAHPMRSCPDAYFWEAQRTLLAASAGLEKPLQVDHEAFRAIRGVLASQAKNQTEMHSATRYAASWPPYLRPADGMDETADAEDSYSRAINAGILMQEAGFAKEERDDALDILQGMTTEGTPTIQQRIAIGGQSCVGGWEASIKATRNAQEAWARFQEPPQPGWKPGPAQYSAMFEKLNMREADGNSHLLPGDKALSFATLWDVNLAEFERARLRPPSVTQLYERMRLSGIRPKGSCLRILVANAECLNTAHSYLRDSAESDTVIASLTADDPKPEQLRAVPMKLFEAYVQVCSRVDGRRGDRPLRRGMYLANLRLDAGCSRWAPVIWGPILKALSQHRRAIMVSRSEQIRLFLRVINRIDESAGMTLPTFIQFAKCNRKVVRRDLPELLIDLETAERAKKNDLRHFYTFDAAGQGTSDAFEKAPYSLIREAAERMKETFNGLVAKEKECQGLLGAYQVAPLDRMACRKDPAGSEHAYEYMISLAFLGEFDEMARTLRWLMEEWGQPDVVAAMQELDEPPPHANFFETLCAFRLLAEPMLGEAVVKSLRQELEAATGWVWPDEEAVTTFVDMQQDDYIATLRRVLDRVRHWETAEWTAEKPQREPATRVDDALVKDVAFDASEAQEARRLHYIPDCILGHGGDGNGVSGAQDDPGNWHCS
ncbi:hypothetical protein OCS_01551 [Ophiocordyceps sinensis CO18]|uniref:Prefoldin subunit n=1 Tax=Ophiocordyceps sinensis (strain Co18 / CGMCC 3.14243) TaxID=911162 RepID=T5AK15_OPHSC|nr:hypothetical protein OCS_01551 [Ophiocordyceps sinensis CO18]